MFNIFSIFLGAILGFVLNEVSQNIGRLNVRVFTSRPDYKTKIEDMNNPEYFNESNVYDFHLNFSIRLKSTFKYEKHITDIHIEVDGLNSSVYFDGKSIFFVNPYKLAEHIVIPSKGFISKEYKIKINEKIYNKYFTNHDIYFSYIDERNKKKRVKVDTSEYLPIQEILNSLKGLRESLIKLEHDDMK